MTFSFNDIEALNQILNPEDEEAKASPYAAFSSGSALTPADATGTRKELAPPNVKLEVKGSRSEKAVKSQIWEEADATQQAADESDDRPAPVYDLQLRQRVGPEDIFLGLSDMDPSSRHCQDLLLRINLPGTKYKDIGLDVEKRVVKLQAPKFKLTLPLPYSVLEAQGSAKWIKDKEVLEVALPIDKEDVQL